ncbi:unnamed protein product [Blepharisma stoltei]|uniref:Importin subunit alpha n=1 Tax=Blepharisma stoltei TaxID=1481888 RepID=A0AAU9JAA2_9CILI|nr:unnamed protein product [Blepharisma stoltei]
MENQLNQRIEDRLKNYQKSLNPDDLKRKHQEGLAELRKKKRIEHINKKRAFGRDPVFDTPQTEESHIVFPYEYISQELANFDRRLVDLELTPSTRISCLISNLNTCEDQGILLHIIQTFRKLLNGKDSPPASLISELNPVVKLLRMLTTKNVPIQSEVSWCLINLTSGKSDISALFAAEDTISILVQMLRTKSPTEILVYCAWTIGNLAGDSIGSRDKAIESKAANQIIEIILKNPRMDYKDIAILVWVLSNLCKGYPSPPLSLVKEVLKIVPAMIDQIYEDILIDICWIISYVSEISPECVNLLIELNIIQKLIDLTTHHNIKIQVPALRSIGNILSGTDEQAQMVLNSGILEKYQILLSTGKRQIKKEALWGISNITAGSDSQAVEVLGHPCVYLVISELNDNDFDLKKEAAYAIGNTTRSKNVNVVRRLFDLNVLPQLINILTHQDPDILIVTLEAINNILRAGRGFGYNDIAKNFQDLEGLEALEKLQSHPNQRIYDKAVQILKEHYEVEEINDLGHQNQYPSDFIFS